MESLYSTYSTLALVYLWYRYLFIFFKNKEYSLFRRSPLFTVVVPTYNEDAQNLEKCVKSVIDADGKKEIFIVDDGSIDKTTKKILSKLKRKYPFLIVNKFRKNKGKRKAHEYVFERAKGKFLVTVDSDTIVNKDAFIKLIAPFQDKKVGAVTGNIKLLNREDNLLTRMISARYWGAFNFERNSLSNWSIVTCCSGPLSAYRKSIILPVLKEYSEQKFLGKQCTYGDDRALTRLVLENYNVVFVNDAIAYTYSPNTLKSFIKQQLRWKKSWIRETYLTSKFMLKRSKLLSFEIFITTIMPILGLFVRLSIFALFFVYPVMIIYYIISMMLMAVVRNMYMLFENPSEFIYSIPYAFVHEFIIFWLYPIALLTLKDTGWGTR